MKKFKLDKNHVIDITDEIFSTIRYMSYRERYINKKDTDHNIIHYCAFDTEESDGENLVRDYSPLPDEIVITKETYNALYDAFSYIIDRRSNLLLYNLFVKGEVFNVV